MARRRQSNDQGPARGRAARLGTTDEALRAGGNSWNPTHGPACKCGHGKRIHSGRKCLGVRCPCKGFSRYDPLR